MYSSCISTKGIEWHLPWPAPHDAAPPVFICPIINEFTHCIRDTIDKWYQMTLALMSTARRLASFFVYWIIENSLILLFTHSTNGLKQHLPWPAPHTLHLQLSQIQSLINSFFVFITHSINEYQMTFALTRTARRSYSSVHLFFNSFGVSFMHSTRGHQIYLIYSTIRAFIHAL